MAYTNDVPPVPNSRNIDIEDLLLKIYANEMSVQFGRKWTSKALADLCRDFQEKTNEKKATTLRQTWGTGLQFFSGAAGVTADAIIKTQPGYGILCKAGSKLLDTTHGHYKGTQNSEGTKYDHKYQVLSNTQNETTNQQREADKATDAMHELLAKHIRREEQFSHSFSSSAA